MSKRLIVRIVLGMLTVLSLLTLTAYTQGEAVDTISVSGSLDYTPEILLMQKAGTTTIVDVTELEVWSGDIAGTATAQDRIMIYPSGVWEAWIIQTVEGTVLGDYEGTLVIMSVWQKESATAHWHGEWVILSGTDDLENAHGFGIGWGPGFNREDPEASPDIYYSGEITFIDGQSRS